MSTFWYPAQPPRAGTLPGAYTDPAVARDGSLHSYWGWPLAWTNIIAQCVTYAIPDLPLAAGTNRFPIVLHSHGRTCDRRLNSQNAEELASHGYIVAAVDHEDCHATVFPDERGVRYVSPAVIGDLGALLRSRTNDLACLLQTLGQMEADDSLLAGRLDLSRIGMTGFSLGAGAAAEIGRADSRVKCVVLMDAYINFDYYPGLGSPGLQKPFLAMNRAILDHPGLLWDFSPHSQRVYSLATQDATWLFIRNSGHFTFSDCAWTVETTADNRRAAAAINACLLWFFDTYLKAGTPPFPENPEIINVQRK